MTEHPLRVELPNFHVCDVRVRFDENMGRGHHAQLSMRVNDVLSGERSSICSSVYIQPGLDKRIVKAMIRDSLRTLLLHELDEQLFIDGDRFTNPHPEQAGGPVHPLPLFECRVVEYSLQRFNRIEPIDTCVTGMLSPSTPRR